MVQGYVGNRLVTKTFLRLGTTLYNTIIIFLFGMAVNQVASFLISRNSRYLNRFLANEHRAPLLANDRRACPRRSVHLIG